MPGFEAILCPVDPAAPSEVVLQHASALGEWFAADVTVLAVRPHGWRAGRVPVTRRNDRQHAEDVPGLEERIRQLSGPSVRVQVVEGAVGGEIVRATRNSRVALVVMGAREPGRIERLLFGSVVEHVLMHTSSPVLIVPPGTGSPPSSTAALFERIVCGVDRSPESRRALAYALSLSRSHLAVVHAVEDFSDEDPRFARHFNTIECWREVEPEIRADYDRLVPEDGRLWCTVEVVVPFGRAGAVLIEAAEARRASLLVIGTAGVHSLFGTTARYVIRKASCPVLAVPRTAARATGRPLRTSSATAAHP